MLERKKRRQLLTVECVRFALKNNLLTVGEENTIMEAFVRFRFASVAITYEYTLRHPSQNEGRGCGAGGIQIRLMDKKPGTITLCYELGEERAKFHNRKSANNL
jgi:hypothetical protein